MFNLKGLISEDNLVRSLSYIFGRIKLNI